MLPGNELPDRGRMFFFVDVGGAKPIAGGVGWRGVPLRTDSRRGQRLLTDTVHSPAPRVSAGLNFAVILLSKAIDIGRDTVHPPLTWSPFPYEGKDLTRRKVGSSSNDGRDTSYFQLLFPSAHSAPRRGSGLIFTSSTASGSPSPQGEGLNALDI